MKRTNNAEQFNIEEAVPGLQNEHLLNQAIPQTSQEINDFIRENEWIVRDVIRPYHGLQDDEDLFQEACIGMVKGINTFNPHKGVRLTTYVYACAANEVKMSLRKTCAKKRSATVISIETITINRDNKDSRPVDIPDPKVDVEGMACTNVMFSKIMNVVNTKLSFPERVTVLNFLDGIPQAETAKMLHTSQGQISKLYNQTLNKIRAEIDPNKE